MAPQLLHLATGALLATWVFGFTVPDCAAFPVFLSISISLLLPIDVGIQPMIAAKPATQNTITAMPAAQAKGWGDEPVLIVCMDMSISLGTCY
jgi:hypothetical protein